MNALTSNIMRARITRIEIVSAPDPDPDLSWLDDASNYAGLPADEVAEYMEQDAERLKAYGDSWWMLGIYAVAHIEVPTMQGGWALRDKITGPGIWGVESDAGGRLLATLGDEQFGELRDILVDGYGFDAAQVDAAKPSDTTPQ